MSTATKTSATAGTAVGTEHARVEGVRSRTVTWTDPGRVRFRLRGLDGYDQLAAMKRDDAGTLYAHAKSTCLIQRRTQ